MGIIPALNSHTFLKQVKGNKWKLYIVIVLYLSLPMSGRLELDDLYGPVQPKPFYGSMIPFYE